MKVGRLCAIALLLISLIGLAVPLQALACDGGGSSKWMANVDLQATRGYGAGAVLRPAAGRVDAMFNGAGHAFQLRAPIPQVQSDARRSIRLDLTLSVSGWKSIRYLAYGLRTKAGRFIHVKNPHPRLGDEFSEALSSFGFERTIEAFDATTDDLEGAFLEVFMHGVPEASGGHISILNARVGAYGGDSCFEGVLATLDSATERSRIASGPIAAFLKTFDEYNRGYYENDLSAARRFVDSGEVALRQVTPIKGDWREKAPPVLKHTTTHRYLWHAQDLSRVLLVAYEKEGDARYAEASYGLLSRWVRDNLEQRGEDQRYIWYDHGVGDRLMTLVMLWRAGIELQWTNDRLRFISRLLAAHADLLASDWFYARNQVSRWHNHGMFQDIALLTAGGLFPLDEARGRWLQVASERLYSQFEALVASDGSSVENSFGYHAATERMCWSSAQWLELTNGQAGGLRTICQRMKRFTAAMIYPDGRGASYGDSFRRVNSTSVMQKGSRPIEESAEVFADSGYAVARGSRGEIPWQVVFIAPSKSTTHKHEDNLNMMYWAGGVEWLVDPGFYSHQYTDPIPEFARSFRAHNAPGIIAGRYSIEPGLATLTPLLNNQSRFSVRGESRAFEGWHVSRVIDVSRGSGAVAITDEVAGSGAPAWQHAFQFGEGVQAELEKDAIRLVYGAVAFSVILRYPDAEKACRIYRGGEAEFYGHTYPGFLLDNPAVAAVCSTTAATKNWSLEIEAR